MGRAAPSWISWASLATAVCACASGRPDQLQAPKMQMWPMAQALPHAPQFCSSLLVLMHPPPQHIWAPMQLWPHVPQLVLLVFRSTHAPAHAERSPQD